MNRLLIRSCTLWVLTISILSSCKKDAGVGGEANIKGKIYGATYDKKMLYKLDSGYIGNVTVNIVYGNETAIGDNQKTSYDGSYNFRYLRKGHYKIFLYSRSFKTKTDDSTLVKEVDITGRKQTIELPDFKIFH